MKSNLFFLLSAAATFALTSCGSKDDQNNESNQIVEELPLIEVDVATSRDVAQAKSYTANVEAFNSNNISPSTPNRIKTITVEVGDPVSRGQIVATLDNSSATQLKVNLDQLERDYNRARQLLEIGSGTQSTVDQMKAQLDAARAQYNNVIENTVLRSPASGVVTARNYDPGDMTQSLPILTVGQISPSVKLLINITESDISGVSAGMPVSVSLDAFPDENFNGTISRIYPQVDPATRTVQAEVIVPNPNGKIFPGMFGRVSLDHGSVNRVVVPDRAVVKQTGSGNRYVYVYKDGKVSYNKVNLGQRIGTAYEVIEGVADGDTVVIAGQTRLADGVEAQLKK